MNLFVTFQHTPSLNSLQPYLIIIACVIVAEVATAEVMTIIHTSNSYFVLPNSS